MAEYPQCQESYVKLTMKRMVAAAVGSVMLTMATIDSNPLMIHGFGPHVDLTRGDASGKVVVRV